VIGQQVLYLKMEEQNMKTVRGFKTIIFIFTLSLAACSPATPVPTTTYTTTPSASPSPLPPTLTPTSTLVPIPTSTPKPPITSTPSTQEEEAWDSVACMNVEALQSFVDSFPQGTYANNAKLYISLFQEIEAIKSDKMVPSFVIPFEQLGERWQTWKERMPGTDALGIYTKSISEVIEMGVFFALPGCRTVAFDEGFPVTPTGDGSIAAFWTNGIKMEYINGIVIESYGEEVLYFAVIEGKGIVHLHGWGKVTMPDGVEYEVR
jgi:hypothetical protein